MVDIASLAIKIDTSDAGRAAADLDKLATKGGAAGKALEKGLTDAAKAAGVYVDAAGRMREASGRFVSEARKVELGLNSIATSAGKAAPSVADVAAGIAQQSDLLKRAGLSAGQYQQAMRMLPMQLTDVVTSLASGMPLWMIAIQQGGQVRDSFGGIGNAATAVASAINPMTAVIGTAAAALAGIGAAYYEGAQESVRFNEALILTGNYAGTTAEQLATLAGQMSGLYGITQSSAADALTKAAETGRFTGEQLKLVATAAEQMRAVTGKAVEETIGEFVKLGKDPVAAILELNDKYHFLEESQLDQIRVLRDQGREQEAVTAAMRTYADVISERTPQITQNLGYIEKAIEAISIGARRTMDDILGIGRALPERERIDKLLAERYTLTANQNRILMSASQKKANQDRIDAITAEIKAMQDAEVERQKRGKSAAVDSEIARATDALNKSLGQQLESLKDLSAYEEAMNTLRREGVDISSKGAQEALAKAKQLDQERAAIEAAEQAERSATAASREAQRQEQQRARQIEQLRAQQESYAGALERQAEILGMSAVEAMRYEVAERGLTGALRERAEVAIEAIAAAEKQRVYQSLVQELRTDEELLNDQLRERLALLDSMPSLSEGDRLRVTGRAVAAAFQEAPEFGGIDASVGGPFGELNKVNDAERELDDWYARQTEMLATYRQERSDLNAEWDAQELQLKQEHENALAGIETARQQAALAGAETTFGNLADLARQFAGEQSGIYRAMFVAQKAAAIAQAAISIQQGIAMAAANPWPVNLAAMATVAASTAGLVGNIAAIGMAHDGIDNIPREGTWLLDKGERVVDRRTNGDLKQFLTSQNQPQQQAPNQTFHMSFPGISSAREAKPATAKAARDFARAAQSASRYS